MQTILLVPLLVFPLLLLLPPLLRVLDTAYPFVLGHNTSDYQQREAPPFGSRVDFLIPSAYEFQQRLDSIVCATGSRRRNADISSASPTKRSTLFPPPPPPPLSFSGQNTTEN